jgi:subtilisin-like proprotein convertase family protein
MGYAGITAQDVQPHSDDYFVYANVLQIQNNMVGKTCPTRITLTHGAPVVNAGLDYTIPKSTPFILSGSATDSNGDTLSYCWEENDSATTQTGANSAASATKTGGPNWRSYSPVATPVRYCPPLSRVVINQSTTPGAEIVVEALSSVARTLNFVLTARDSYPGAGLTGSDAMVVTVNATAGPFLVTSPNTNVDWPVGTTQDITWDVAGTTANNVNAATVDIFLSTDGGFTYPITLATNVPNDGLESVVIPNNIGTNNRVMVKGHNHIFYDISNTNFTISQSLTDFTITGINGLSFASCTGLDAVKQIQYTTYAGFNANTTLTVSGQPAGSTVTFSPNPINTTGVITMTVSNTSGATPGSYSLLVTGTSGSIVKSITMPFQLYNSTFPASSLTSPANMATSQSNNLNLTWVANSNAASYDVQVSTVSDFSTIYSSGNVTSNTYTLTGLANLTSYYWRIKPRNPSCEGPFSSAFMFTTGNIVCNTIASTNVPVAISATGTPTVTSTLTIPPTNSVILNDVNVTVNITHTWVADLTISLISPNNTTVNLVVTQCTNNDNVNATFDDAGTTLVCATNPAIAGTIIPTQPLSALNGQDSQGLWTLRVADGANQDGGAINSWSLNFCGVQNLSTISNTIQNFSLYPNPNNGNFNIQFNSNSSKDISLEVFDLRGRNVYTNSYKNNGFFNENIQLNSVQSGVYLVSINDGENKITKKVVLQ